MFDWSDPRAVRANNFDAIRFALACLVIFSHSLALASGVHAFEPLA